MSLHLNICPRSELGRSGECIWATTRVLRQRRFSDCVNRKWTYIHLGSGFAHIFGQIISIRVKGTKQIKPIQIQLRQGILKGKRPHLR